MQVEAVLQLLVGAAAAAAPQEGRGEPRLPRLRDPVLVPAEDADPEEDEGEGAVEEDLCQQVEQPEAALGSQGHLLLVCVPPVNINLIELCGEGLQQYYA